MKKYDNGFEEQVAKQISEDNLHHTVLHESSVAGSLQRMRERTKLKVRSEPESENLNQKQITRSESEV